MSPSSRAIGLYGGTFDPIHLGHLQVAAAARDALGLAHVVLLPAASPPLRDVPGASADDRLAMTRLAVEGDAGFAVDDRELRRAGPSYTFDTLCELRAEVGPAQPLAWLLGRDAFAQLPRWHRWRELTDVAHLVVLDRPHAVDATFEGTEEGFCAELDAWLAPRRVHDGAVVHGAVAGHVYFHRGPLVPISASLVRARIAAGESAAELLPPKVWSYICQRTLYGVHARASHGAQSRASQRGDPRNEAREQTGGVS